MDRSVSFLNCILVTPRQDCKPGPNSFGTDYPHKTTKRSLRDDLWAILLCTDRTPSGSAKQNEWNRGIEDVRWLSDKELLTIGITAHKDMNAQQDS